MTGGLFGVERLQAVIELCDMALLGHRLEAASGLHAKFLKIKARALEARFQHKDALSCLEGVLKLDSVDVEAQLMRARVSLFETPEAGN